MKACPLSTPPEHIELKTGETRTIRLPGLGTAGYVWNHELRSATKILDAKWQRGMPATDPGAPIGQSPPETITLRAITPGRAKLRLLQQRPWESAGAPLNSFDVDVVVTQRE